MLSHSYNTRLTTTSGLTSKMFFSKSIRDSESCSRHKFINFAIKKNENHRTFRRNELGIYP